MAIPVLSCCPRIFLEELKNPSKTLRIAGHQAKIHTQNIFNIK
jgi:hypothetical protein